jgi:SRSO17 transposase
MDGLAKAAGHADRRTRFKSYCKGLLLPGERKSIEPMAARLAPDEVGRMHQSLHHVVAAAPWSDDEVLAEVRRQVLPVMQKHGPVVAWIVDDTGFPKQGKHSVGVARQYCGQIGKHDNCQAAVSLSVSTWSASLPIAWRLYLPEAWTQNPERCRQAGVPEEIEFQTKPEIALEQIRQAVEQKVPTGIILADAGYGNRTAFRTAVTELGLQYAMGVESSTTVWEPGQQPLRRPRENPAVARHPNACSAAKIISRFLQQLALALPASAWKQVRWRQGTQGMLRSRSAAVRIRQAHRDYKRTEPHPEQWLVIEWPKKQSEPTKYWLSTMPPATSLQALVKMAKHRRIIERDDEELKQELELGHYEDEVGGDFTVTPHSALQLMGSSSASGTVFPLSPRGHVGLSIPQRSPKFRPRGSPGPPRAA